MTTEEVSEFSLPADLGEVPTVKHWLDAQAKHWNRAQGEAESRRKLDTLRAFCEVIQVDPDALVKGLFRPTPEGPRIRLKRRREVIAQIEEFEAKARETADARRARDTGNVIRSFLIHNGVAMSAPAFR
jgi:hypothetical protein